MEAQAILILRGFNCMLCHAYTENSPRRRSPLATTRSFALFNIRETALRARHRYDHPTLPAWSQHLRSIYFRYKNI